MEYRGLEDPVALCESAAGEGYDDDVVGVSEECGGCRVASDCGGNLVQ